MKRTPPTLLPSILLLAACADTTPGEDGGAATSTGTAMSTDAGTTMSTPQDTGDPDDSAGSDDAGETEDTSGSDDTGDPGSTGEPPPQVFEACEDFSIELTEPNPMLVWTPNAIELVSEELAPGVFAVYDSNSEAYEPMGLPLATSSGFVIGDDGVALIDTMINRQLLCQLEDLVREQTDLPILYAINTSYHGDHSYGNAFLPEDVEVVQHERTADYIAMYFEEDTAFMEANFGTDQGIDEVVPVVPDIEVTDAGWSGDLGGKTVEAQYLGFGQTDGDLFVYIPEAQVLWTGNPLIAEPPAIPWLLDGHGEDVATTLAAAQASLSANAIVVPGHGGPTTAGTFDFSVDYLTTLVAEVQTAVDDGATVEETVEQVTMETFQGYVLWDWVHSVVNVPNTYDELSP